MRQEMSTTRGSMSDLTTATDQTRRRWRGALAFVACEELDNSRECSRRTKLPALLSCACDRSRPVPFPCVPARHNSTKKNDFSEKMHGIAPSDFLRNNFAKKKFNGSNMLSKYRKNPKIIILLSFLTYCQIRLSSLVDDEQPTYLTNFGGKKKQYLYPWITIVTCDVGPSVNSIPN